MAYFYNKCKEEGLSESTAETLLQSIAPSSLHAYKRAWNSFKSWFDDQRNPDGITIPLICDFLSYKFKDGLNVNTLNLLRSALSFFCNTADMKIGDNLYITRLFSSFSKLRPTKPKYITFWPVEKVLTLLSSWHPAQDLDLKLLTLKTLALIALTCSDRGQTIHAMNVEDVHIAENEVVFVIYKLMKTSKFHKSPHTVRCIKSDIPELDVCDYVLSYMNRTLLYRAKAVNAGKDKPIQLFLSWKTKMPVSRPTLARWLKTVLKLSDINVSQYSAHSFRGSGLSAAFNRGAFLTQIMEAGNCTNTNTFKTFYNKEADNSPVGKIILRTFNDNLIKQ